MNKFATKTIASKSEKVFQLEQKHYTQTHTNKHTCNKIE